MSILSRIKRYLLGDYYRTCFVCNGHCWVRTCDGTEMPCFECSGTGEVDLRDYPGGVA